MDKEVNVSVVIPVYNAQKYIKNCLFSIISQTYKDIEIICVNDGSVDNSLKILKEYEKEYDFIKVIDSKHEGIGAARNKGLDAARGKYLQFIDADDWISADAIEKCVKKAQESDLDIVCFNVANYDNETKLIVENQFYPHNFWPRNAENMVLTWKDYRNIFCGNFSSVNKLYRLEFLRENGIRFLEKLNFEDLPFHLKSFMDASRIGVINSSLYFYRKNIKASFMGSMGRDGRIFDIFPILEELRKIVEQKGRFENLKYSYFELMLSLYRGMYLNDSSLFAKPKFYSKIKDNLKKIEENSEDREAVMKIKSSFLFFDFLTCSWMVFLIKYKLLEIGREANLKLEKMRAE